MWSILTFLLNAALFILIGLQLPTIVDGLSGRPAGEVVGYAAAVCAAVILVRFVWHFAMTALIRAIDRRPSQRARRAGWRVRVIGSWSGMRGAVSLAAALALPLHTNAGDPLPVRDLIQRYTEVLLAEAQQIGACNAMHGAQARLCRWLLQCADRTGRDELPLIYCGESLVSVPGIGDACEFQAAPGQAGLTRSDYPESRRTIS